MRAVREHIAVLSPHLDDAVFSCGELLAARPGSAVVTVFAGAPPPGASLTEWDATSGFRPGDDVAALRRAEDGAACAVLDAEPCWLDFRDAQYGASPPVAELTDALLVAVAAAEATTLLLPIGLFHGDHHRTHAAALGVLAARPQLAPLAYEDAIYRRIPGLLPERLAALRAAGYAPARVSGSGCSARKRAAVACYASQLRALVTPGRPGIADVFAAEGFWSLGA